MDNHGFLKTTHAEVAVGETVYFDNYQDGAFPHANPKILGPFVKVRDRQFMNKSGRKFWHYPENLLKQCASGSG